MARFLPWAGRRLLRDRIPIEGDEESKESIARGKDYWLPRALRSVTLRPALRREGESRVTPGGWPIETWQDQMSQGDVGAASLVVFKGAGVDFRVFESEGSSCAS